MAKVKVQFDAEAFSARVRQTFLKVKTNKELQSKIGEVVVKRVQGEARRKRPLNNSGTFPTLRKATVANRKRLAKYNTTHPTFSERRSNLSFTGQLIDAVGYKTGRDAVEVLVEDTSRKPYVTGKDGQRAKKTPDNNELAGFLRDKGFQLFSAKGIRESKGISKQIRNQVLLFLRRALKVAQLRD